MGSRLVLLRLVLLVGGALLATGCAGLRPSPPAEGEAKAVYATFLANQAKTPPPQAFSLTGSMSFAAGHKSGRLNFRFFGNMADPCRLDLSTTLGGAYAFLREDAAEFTAFAPGKNTVYHHPDTRAGAAKLGMPLPFTLRELAALAAGRYGELAPTTYASAKKVKDGYQFTFSGDPRLSALTLDFEGNPRHLSGRGVEPWQVDFANAEAGPGLVTPVARKLTLTTPGGASLVIRVKSLAVRPDPYPAADLELPLPAQAASRSLENSEDGSPLPAL